MAERFKREYGIDLIKALAIFCVINVHFFAHTQFYSTPVSGKNMFLQSILRWFFMSAVPLFITATGYLQNGKTVSKNFYIKILRIIVVYSLISIIALQFDIYFLKDKFTLASAVLSVFNFTADGYGWYVNMFIGLYLLIPFLNLIFNVLTKRQAQLLLAVLLFIISFPSTFNVLFALKPKFDVLFFPDWWSAFYPVLYYFIGAYIYKYKPHFNKPACGLIILSALIFQTCCLKWAAAAIGSNNWFLDSYSSLFLVVQTVCIFIILYDIHGGKMLVSSSPVIRKISALTLEMYLFSFIVDDLFYSSQMTGLLKHFSNQREIFEYNYFKIIPLDFIACFIIAVVFSFLYGRVIQLYSVFHKRVGLFRRKLGPEMKT